MLDWLRTEFSLTAIAGGLWISFGFMAWNWDVQSWDPVGRGALAGAWAICAMIFILVNTIKSTWSR